MGEQTGQASTPAGWYDDPAAAHLIRWWDGAKWTEHTQPKIDASGSPMKQDLLTGGAPLPTGASPKPSLTPQGAISGVTMGLGVTPPGAPQPAQEVAGSPVMPSANESTGAGNQSIPGSVPGSESYAVGTDQPIPGAIPGSAPYVMGDRGNSRLEDVAETMLGIMPLGRTVLRRRDEEESRPNTPGARVTAPVGAAQGQGTQPIPGGIPLPTSPPQMPPASPKAGGSEKASYGKRLGAWFIDGMVSIPVFIIGLFAVIPHIVDDSTGDGMFAFHLSETGKLMLLLVGVLWFLIGSYNHVWREGRTGQTLGKASQRLKLVDVETNKPIGMGRAAARWYVSRTVFTVTLVFGGVIGQILWSLDHLWPLWDKDGQRLIDKVTRSKVIED